MPNIGPQFYTTTIQFIYLIFYPNLDLSKGVQKVNYSFLHLLLIPLRTQYVILELHPNTCIWRETQMQMTHTPSWSYISPFPKSCAEMSRLYTNLRINICTFMHWACPFFSSCYCSNIFSENSGEGPFYRKPKFQTISNSLHDHTSILMNYLIKIHRTHLSCLFTFKILLLI